MPGAAPIRSDELFSSWARNLWKPVYLFAGTEDFLIDQAVQQATRHWLTGDASGGLNLDRYDAQSHSAGEILQAAQTVPFLGNVRVVRVAHASAFSPTDQKILAEHLSSLPPETRLILAWGREWRRDDAKKALVEAIGQRGQVVIFWPPFPEAARQWAIDRAKREYSKTLTPAAGSWLVHHSLEGLRFLDQELAKAASFVGGRPEIDVDDLQQSSGYERASSPFDWTAQIRQRKSSAAVKTLEKLLNEGEEPVRLLALLSRTLRDWLSAISSREPAAAMAMRFHVRRGEENQFARELSLWREDELIDSLNLAVLTEQGIKTGKETPAMGLTLLTLELGKLSGLPR